MGSRCQPGDDLSDQQILLTAHHIRKAELTIGNVDPCSLLSHRAPAAQPALRGCVWRFLR